MKRHELSLSLRVTIKGRTVLLNYLHYLLLLDAPPLTFFQTQSINSTLQFEVNLEQWSWTVHYCFLTPELWLGLVLLLHWIRTGSRCCQLMALRCSPFWLGCHALDILIVWNIGYRYKYRTKVSSPSSRSGMLLHLLMVNAWAAVNLISWNAACHVSLAARLHTRRKCQANGPYRPKNGRIVKEYTKKV